MLSLTTLRSSVCSLAISSTIGAIARHGGHHGAQKSTSTGLSDSSTSAWKFWSLTSEIPDICLFLILRKGILHKVERPVQGVATAFAPDEKLSPSSVAYGVRWRTRPTARFRRRSTSSAI